MIVDQLSGCIVFDVGKPPLSRARRSSRINLWGLLAPSRRLARLSRSFALPGTMAVGGRWNRVGVV